MPIKSVKIQIFEKSKGSFNPKIRFISQKVCPVACLHTQLHRQSDYCGHPFRVSGFFPSTYHQGSAQYFEAVFIPRSINSIDFNNCKNELLLKTSGDLLLMVKYYQILT